MADDATNWKPGAAFDKLRQRARWQRVCQQRTRWLSLSKPGAAFDKLRQRAYSAACVLAAGALAAGALAAGALAELVEAGCCLRQAQAAGALEAGCCLRQAQAAGALAAGALAELVEANEDTRHLPKRSRSYEPCQRRTLLKNRWRGSVQTSEQAICHLNVRGRISEIGQGRVSEATRRLPMIVAAK